MGIKNIASNIPENPPENQRQEIELVGGEQNPVFQEVENLRKQFNGAYSQYKLRGGSVPKQTLDAAILTQHSFSASPNNVQKDFTAIHTASGSIYLIDKATHIDPATPAAAPKIFDALFSTITPVTFLNSGNFLYIFGVDGGVKKVYDFVKEEGYDWLNNISGSITDYTWNEFTDWREDNIWGFEEGAEIIVLNSFQEAAYTPEGSTDPAVISFVSKVENVFDDRFSYTDPIARQFLSNQSDSIGVLPNSPDLAGYLGIQGNIVHTIGTNFTANPEFETPLIYRGYIIVDLLADGSYLTPGRPITVSTSMFNLNQRRKSSIDFTITAPASNVEKRLLFCTRWQINPENAFSPSRPEYDNSAFFFAKEIDISQLSFTDSTPDNKLFAGIASRLPLRAGVLQTFGKGQLEPNSVASIRGNILLGGYTVNRPVPEPYGSALNPDEKNVYMNIGAGTALTGNPKISLVFEYTDGKKSNPVEFPTVLTDSNQIIDEGSSGTRAEGDLLFGSEPTADGSITVTLKDTADSATFPYFAGEPTWQIAERARNNINWFIAADVTASLAGAGDITRIRADDIGTAGNSIIFTISFDTDITINGDATGLFDLQLSGGLEPVDAISVSGNEMYVHSLNALVDKVFVLITRDAMPAKLFKEFQSSRGHFHGRRLLLPNHIDEVNALNNFIVPTGTDIREVVDLFDYMVAGTPFQEIRISEQARIRDSAIIEKVIPTRFDMDKNVMRQRVVVFTDRNIQIGYLVITEGGIDYDFEIIGQGSALLYFYSCGFVEGNVIYQAADGIYRLRDNEYTKIIDRYQYDLLNSDLWYVMFNRDHKEYWLFFRDHKIIVTSPEGEIRYRFRWPVAFGFVSCGSYIGDTLLLGIGSKIYLGDVPEEYDDTTPITGHLVTDHIGNPNGQAKIMEVAVAGQGLTGDVALDLQKQRLEKNTGAWSKGFTADAAVTLKTIYMHGTPFTFSHRGVMPKAKISVIGDSVGFISHILLTYIAMENKGKARY